VTRIAFVRWDNRTAEVIWRKGGYFVQLMPAGHSYMTADWLKALAGATVYIRDGFEAFERYWRKG